MFDIPKVSTAEIHHLANLLGGGGIPYEIEEHFGGLHIGYPNLTECECSVIQHYFSFGGQQGYLEIMGLLTEEERAEDSVKGWLTAVEVFNRINTHWNTCRSTRSD